jgi:ADP-ribose pyrophosphatase YjhB (NUDIX family)
VCADDDNSKLLVRSQQQWTLPGGGVEQGEDPFDAVVREVEDQAGLKVEVSRLLGLDSRTRRVDRAGGEVHSVGVFYEVTVRDGVAGEYAAWLSDDEPADRTPIVEVARELSRLRPASGHLG